MLDDGYVFTHACEDCRGELSAYDVAHGYDVCEECGEDRARWVSAELDRLLSVAPYELAGRVIA